jgi:TolB-like protein
MSGDPEQEYFSDGITEDITTELSRFSELFVIARNTAFTYKSQPPNITEIARELGVHFVLEGSVRKAANRVRINAQLIDGEDGNHLWADRYDGSVEEIFDLQDEVTRQVVSAIVPHIDEAELTRIRRGDQVFDDAHDLAWQALDEYEKAGRLAQPVLMEAAKAKALRAIELNDRCYRAYYVVCMAGWRELLMQWSDDPDESRTQLKEAAETYVSLAPHSHRSHFCNGIAKLFGGRPEASAQDFRHSVELNPNDAMVHAVLAYAEVQSGNLNDAKAIAQKALRLNPKDTSTGPAYLALAQAAFAEDDSQFRHWAEKAIQAQPNAPIRRALMIAHAAEVGDQALLEEHLQHLNTVAPRFIPRLLNGESDPIRIPQYREKFLTALRKAVSSE